MGGGVGGEGTSCRYEIEARGVGEGGISAHSHQLDLRFLPLPIVSRAPFVTLIL